MVFLTQSIWIRVEEYKNFTWSLTWFLIVYPTLGIYFKNLIIMLNLTNNRINITITVAQLTTVKTALFQQFIFYIHNNPVHHGFVKQMSLYPWSSYEIIISEKLTRLKREEIIGQFGDIENFIVCHNQQHNLN